MGLTREFITPAIEVVRSDANLTSADVREWAEARLAFLRDEWPSGQPYGLVVDVREAGNVSIEIMAIMIDLVRKTQTSPGHVAVVGAARLTAGMTEAVMRLAPQRRERFRMFDGFDEALEWVEAALGQ